MDPAAWVQLIGQGGLTAALALWIYTERQGRLEEREDRMALQKERDALLERTLNALNDVTAAVRSATSVQQATQEIVKILRDTIIHGPRGDSDAPR